MSKRIGIDARIWRSETGGLGRYARNLVTELLKIDQENEYTVIITPADEKEFTLDAPNCRSLVVDIPHYSVAEQKALPKILNEQRFDLVHFTHFNHPIFYRKPFVVTIHDLIMHLFPTGAQTRSTIRKAAYKLVMNDTKRAKKVIVPSESTKQDLISMLQFSPENIVVTPEGSEKKFRLHSQKEIEAIKQKYNLPDRYALFVSRWEKYKGLVSLIEAYESLLPKFPNLALVICGKPAHQSPEVAQLVYDKQAAGLNIITPGFISDEDLAAMYSAASVYVHPSWYEGFGIMILEAFASGVPVVTSNVSSLPEVVDTAGLLINPHKPQEIANAIERILLQPKLAEELRRRGLERLKQFSWAKMAKMTQDVYRQVLHQD